MYLERQNLVLDRFLKKRSSIIDKYNRKVIDKREFLEKNYNLISRTGMNPFVIVDSFEKGMYNYQYYNTLAKYNKSLARQIDINPSKRRDIRDRNNYLNKSSHYYDMKDRASKDLCDYLKYQNIDAYMIETESTNLKGRLYEIVLWDYQEAIFHSTSEWLLEELKKAGVFKSGTRRSLICSYINEKY